MKLYDFAIAPNPKKVRVYLHEKGIEMPLEPVDLPGGQNRTPDFLRQVLLLAYYQGLKYREIADILGIPVGTVKSRLHAALVKLQEVWNESPSLYEV